MATNKISFPTQYDAHERIFIHSGERFAPVYKSVVDDNGAIDLVQDGVIDVYNEIQSHADSCDIHVILDQFQRTGDLSLIQKTTGAYFDATEFPKTYAEMYQRVLDAERLFSQLTPEVRAKFNNSPSEFFASIGSKEFYDAIGENLPEEKKDPEVVKEEVKPVE